MPGYIMHLACAEQVLKIIQNKDRNWENQFRLGSIAADTCEKRESHFWDENMLRFLDRSPNLELFLNKYKQFMKDPYIFGYYAHLYLDYVFVRGYWQKHFVFYDKDKRLNRAFEQVKWVFLKDKEIWIDRKKFFSKELYYGDYDRMNDYMKTRYQVELPYLKKPEREVSEAPWEKAENGLRNMLLQLQTLNHGEGEGFLPPLNIFTLSDLVSMIETSAKEIARLCA